MSRSQFDEDVPLPPHGAAPGNGRYLACITCANPTDTKTLMEFGARCFPCYQAYCRQPTHSDIPSGPVTGTPAQRIVKHLEAIEAVRRLTGSQKDMLAACRKVSGQGTL